jgi:putative Mn2+ efflux pump MntP
MGLIPDNSSCASSLGVRTCRISRSGKHEIIGATIWVPAVVIGIVTGLGLRLGNKLGEKFGKRMEIIGGMLLILLGLRILLAHLMV